MPPSPSSPVTKVLVVEDQPDDFRFLTYVFARTRRRRFQLDWVDNYDDGLAAVRRGRHDVALVDYSLGGATGIDLLRAARAAGCTMPLLVLTGHDSPEIDEAALEAGAVDFLSKAELEPVSLDRALRYALSQAEMRASLLRSQQQLDLFLRSVPCAVAIHGADGRPLFQNDAYRAHFQPEAGDGRAPTGRGGRRNGTPELRHFGGRHWMVTTFAMDGDGELRGTAALDVTERIKADAERRRATHLLDTIMQTLPAVAGRLDADGTVVEAHGHGLEHLGLRPAAATRRKFADLFPQAADAVREALGGGAANLTLSGRRGEQDWHADFFLTFDSVHGAGVTFFGRDVTSRRWLEHRLLTVSDAEQQRIGADLHDGLGQQLTGLSCLAAALQERLEKLGLEDVATARTISRLADDAIAQARALARGLCPVQLENAGLVEALEELASQAHTLHGVECRFTRKGLPSCDHLAAMHLYRIAQEAITNAVRHGRARRISLELTSQRRRHRLVIADDGVGFPAGARARGAAGGLRLMGYRAAMLGGIFSVESEPGRGTRITCSFTTFASHHENGNLEKTHHHPIPAGALEGVGAASHPAG
ncbi:MAG TPA: response regulator [Lacunisphaera sp.]|nr:response regulator [Lacunisphaera sp.]